MLIVHLEKIRRSPIVQGLGGSQLGLDLRYFTHFLTGRNRFLLNPRPVPVQASPILRLTTTHYENLTFTLSVHKFFTGHRYHHGIVSDCLAIA
ncbi:MAG: hypothetical protein AAGG51_15610 [Cyanobacteria bacterium P01_G01_bin.54]